MLYLTETYEISARLSNVLSEHRHYKGGIFDTGQDMFIPFGRFLAFSKEQIPWYFNQLPVELKVLDANRTKSNKEYLEHTQKAIERFGRCKIVTHPTWRSVASAVFVADYLEINDAEVVTLESLDRSYIQRLEEGEFSSDVLDVRGVWNLWLSYETINRHMDRFFYILFNENEQKRKKLNVTWATASILAQHKASNEDKAGQFGIEAIAIGDNDEQLSFLLVDDNGKPKRFAKKSATTQINFVFESFGTLETPSQETLKDYLLGVEGNSWFEQLVSNVKAKPEDIIACLKYLFNAGVVSWPFYWLSSPRLLGRFSSKVLLNLDDKGLKRIGLNRDRITVLMSVYKVLSTEDQERHYFYKSNDRWFRLTEGANKPFNSKKNKYKIINFRILRISSEQNYPILKFLSRTANRWISEQQDFSQLYSDLSRLKSQSVLRSTKGNSLSIDHKLRSIFSHTPEEVFDEELGNYLFSKIKFTSADAPLLPALQKLVMEYLSKVANKLHDSRYDILEAVGKKEKCVYCEDGQMYRSVGEFGPYYHCNKCHKNRMEFKGGPAPMMVGEDKVCEACNQGIYRPRKQGLGEDIVMSLICNKCGDVYATS